VTLAACDVCGAGDPKLLFESPRLDGPLVRCVNCGVIYVGARRGDYTFAGTDDARSLALAARVAELGIVRHDVEEAERPWRVQADRERLARLTRHSSGGRLLDVGCATGLFLQVASAAFDAHGVEPDPITSDQARAAGHDVVTGTVQDVTGRFEAITLFHVLEHLDSPRATLARVRELLTPGGIVLIETPTVDSVWFRVAPRRWRQLIPDHYYFFSRTTLDVLLRRCGLEPIEHAKVGRRVSLRFIADRLRRSGVPFSGALAALVRRGRLAERTAYVNPGDIISVVARAVD
jgi:SAM-dependent methyltransferase